VTAEAKSREEPHEGVITARAARAASGAVAEAAESQLLV
jgi:hypothetical protein